MFLARGRHEFPSAHGEDKVRPRLVTPFWECSPSCGVSALTQVLRKPLWLLWISLAFVLCVRGWKMTIPLRTAWLERRLLGKRRETRRNVRNG